MNAPLRVRELGRQPYLPVWHAMRAFTDARDAATVDELWVLEHDPVFTLGVAGRPEHVLAAGGIPVLDVDRGGQVTYHGPGQLVVYALLDVRRMKLGVRELVGALEQAVVDLLDGLDVRGYARADAPGVYVAGAKVASVGLRIRRGASYHGLALNIEPDLEPFSRIDPCGFAGLPVTRIADLCPQVRSDEVKRRFLACLLKRLGRDAVAGPPSLPGA